MKGNLMEKGIVVRNDSVWQGHPDVTFFRGKIYVTFRESDRHATRGKTRIMLTSSDDGDKFDKPYCIADTKNRFNCPRLSIIDDRLYLICDEVDASKNYRGAENDESKTKIHIWKTCNGTSWQTPITTNIKGIVPDKICQTKDGHFAIATHTSKVFGNTSRLSDEEQKNSSKLVQNLWKTDDLRGEWTKYELCHSSEHNFCEATLCKLPDDSFFTLMRENSGLGLPAFYSASGSDCINWSRPVATRMFGCHRPVSGLLKSGNILTTYREAAHSTRRGFWAKNTFACWTKMTRHGPDFVSSIILPLDHDQSSVSDSGYTGWVQLEDKSIYIVNYITADAPQPFIRWYRITEGEF